MDSDEFESYKQELDDIPEKDIWLEIMVELKTIRYGLQTGDFGEIQETSEEPDLFECDICGDKVPKEDREDHAEKEHNLPNAIDATTEFTKA